MNNLKIRIGALALASTMTFSLVGNQASAQGENYTYNTYKILVDYNKDNNDKYYLVDYNINNPNLSKVIGEYSSLEEAENKKDELIEYINTYSPTNVDTKYKL